MEVNGQLHVIDYLKQAKFTAFVETMNCFHFHLTEVTCTLQHSVRKQKWKILLFFIPMPLGVKYH